MLRPPQNKKSFGGFSIFLGQGFLFFFELGGVCTLFFAAFLLLQDGGHECQVNC